MQELIIFWKHRHPLRAALTHKTQGTSEPSVSPEVVPGNVEPSNDSVESLNSPASPTTHETVSRVKLPKFEFKKFDGDVCYKVEYILGRLRGLYSQKHYHLQVQLVELYFGENSQ